MAYAFDPACRLSNRTVTEIALSLVKILLVEDNPTSKAVTQRMLERLGCQVDAVEDGELAMERLSNQVYDLVIVDQNLPNASGFDVIDALRSGKLGSRTQNVDVVLLSGNEPDSAQKTWLELRWVEHRMKPVSLAELDVLVSRRRCDELTPKK